MEDSLSLHPIRKNTKRIKNAKLNKPMINDCTLVVNENYVEQRITDLYPEDSIALSDG